MSKALATKHVAAVAIGIGLVLALSFSFATPAKAQTIADLQAMINQLLAQIAALQGGTGSQQTGGLACYTFTRNHSLGNSGGEVMWIQKFLNSVDGTQLATTGAGSPGNETSYFGGLTRAAVSKFQQKYGITPTAGYWGPISRAKANSLCVPGPVTPPGPGPAPVPIGGGLRVQLAVDNPAASTIVKSQGIANLAKFTFTNGTGAAVNVTNLAFKRIGVSTDSDFVNVYLYDGARRLTDPAGISSSNFSFNDSGGLFTVPAGGSISISVRVDIGTTNGNQVGVQLTGVTASAPLDTSVVLPISGNLHLISNATIATATWGTVTPSNGTFAPSNDVTLFQATLTVNNRASWLHSIQFENRGSTKDGDFTNIKLLIKGNQVATGSLVNDKIVFDLSGNPLRLETGANEIRLVGDILGTSGETFDFQVRRGTDILLVDSELNQPLKPDAPTAVTANTVEGVSLSVTKANTSPTENVAVASTGVLWSRFEFRAAGDRLKIEQITVDVDDSVLATDTMDNVRIMLDGVQVGSTADVSADTGTTFSLGSSMILEPGKTHVVEVYGDAKTSAGVNYASADVVDVGVSIATADTEGIASGDRLTSAISEVEGNSRTVTSSTITGTKASGYGNQTIVAGANNAKLGSFTLSTGSTEGVNVNTIVINLSAAEAASITDLRLVDNATGAQIGTAKSSPSSGDTADNTFSVNVAMGSSQTKVIDVYGNIKSGANSGPWIATLDSTTGGTGAVTGQSVTIGSDQALQTITIGSGTLTVTRDAGTPVNSNVIAGTSNVHVGKFDFHGANSTFTVQELKIKVPNDAATSVASVTLKYKNSAGAEQTVSQALSTGNEAHATATFTGLSLYVPLNDSADLDVYVDVPTVSSGAHSGAAISVLIDADEGFKALDSAGSSDTEAASADVNSAANSGYGSKYVKKSIPTIARLTTGYTTNTVTTNIGLYRFSVAADSAGSIDWRELSFTVTTSGVVVSGFTLYDVTGTAVAINDNTADADTGTLSICPDASCTDGEAEQVGAGGSKTYELRADTVTGWGDAGDQLTIYFAEDTDVVTNNSAANLHSGDNIVWSDRSNTSHTTATTDWTNGYLLKDLDNDTRSCQFGTATTCTP